MKYLVRFITVFTILYTVWSCANNKSSDPSPNNTSKIKCLTPADSAAVTFAKDIAPLVSSNCEICHNPVNLSGGYSFENYKDISGNADLINAAITGQKGLQPMPPAGKLSNCDIEKIMLWIQNGKQNN